MCDADITQRSDVIHMQTSVSYAFTIVLYLGCPYAQQRQRHKTTKRIWTQTRSVPVPRKDII